MILNHNLPTNVPPTASRSLFSSLIDLHIHLLPSTPDIFTDHEFWKQKRYHGCWDASKFHRKSGRHFRQTVMVSQHYADHSSLHMPQSIINTRFADSGFRSSKTISRWRGTQWKQYWRTIDAADEANEAEEVQCVSISDQDSEDMSDTREMMSSLIITRPQTFSTLIFESDFQFYEVKFIIRCITRSSAWREPDLGVSPRECSRT